MNANNAQVWPLQDANKQIPEALARLGAKFGMREGFIMDAGWRIDGPT